jgi:hypothetical protein
MRPLYLVIVYICLLHLGPILNLFGLIPGGRVFPITTLGHLLVIYLALRYFTMIGRSGLTHLDLLVTAFLAWSLASFVLYFQSDNPSQLSAYAYGVHLYVMPIFGYFAVKTLSVRDQQRALSFFLWSNVCLIVVGLYLWWAKPDFYTVFLRQILFEEKEDWTDLMIYLRLQSYLGSTALGAICAVTVALAGAVGTSVWKTIAVVSVSLPAVILTYQRGGQAATALALASLIFWGKGSRTTRILIFAGSLILAAGVLIGLTMHSDAGLGYYLQRRSDFSTQMLAERSGGYTMGMVYATAFPLGIGLGGSGNAASDAGLQNWGRVVDANFMRILADLGVQGLMLFLLIIGVAIHAGLRKRKNTGLACIIAIYAIIAIGTNVFDGHLTPQLFWLIMGIADTPGEVSGQKPALALAPMDAPDLSVLQPAAQKSAPL